MIHFVLKQIPTKFQKVATRHHQGGPESIHLFFLKNVWSRRLDDSTGNCGAPIILHCVEQSDAKPTFQRFFFFYTPIFATPTWVKTTILRSFFWSEFKSPNFWYRNCDSRMSCLKKIRRDPTTKEFVHSCQNQSPFRGFASELAFSCYFFGP